MLVKFAGALYERKELVLNFETGWWEEHVLREVSRKVVLNAPLRQLVTNTSNTRKRPVDDALFQETG